MMYGFWDIFLVGLALAASLGYAGRRFLPAPIKRRLAGGAAAALRRLPSGGAAQRLAARLDAAMARHSAGGCGACGGCAPAATEVAVPVAKIRRR